MSAKQLAPAETAKVRVSNFTSGIHRQALRTCTLLTRGRTIMVRDETEKKQMAIHIASKKALEQLLGFCEIALREWKE